MTGTVTSYLDDDGAFFRDTDEAIWPTREEWQDILLDEYGDLPEHKREPFLRELDDEMADWLRAVVALATAQVLAAVDGTAEKETAAAAATAA